jgi:hypothetical protein
MSTRSGLRLGLIVAGCVAVIVLSAYLREQLTPVSGPFRFRELLRWPGFVALRAFGDPEVFRGRPPALPGWRVIASVGAAYVFLFLVGMLTLFVIPRRMRVLRDAFRPRIGGWLRLLGVGACGAVVLALLSVLGLFTLPPLLPVPFVLPLALFLAVWGGLVGLALAVGHAVSRWAGLAQPWPVLDLALGTLALYSLVRVPLAGPVILTLLGALALGAMILTRFGGGGAWSLAEFQPREDVQS